MDTIEKDKAKNRQKHEKSWKKGRSIRSIRSVVCSTPRVNDKLEWVATAVTTPTTLAHSCWCRCRSRCWCWDWNLYACIAVSVRCGHHFPSGLLLCALWPPPFLILRSSTISCSKLSCIHRGSTSQLWLHLLARDKGILFRQVISKQGHSQDSHGQTNAKAWKERKSAAHLWCQNKSYKSEKMPMELLYSYILPQRLVPGRKAKELLFNLVSSQGFARMTHVWQINSACAQKRKYVKNWATHPMQRAAPTEYHCRPSNGDGDRKQIW